MLAPSVGTRLGSQPAAGGNVGGGVADAEAGEVRPVTLFELPEALHVVVGAGELGDKCAQDLGGARVAVGHGHRGTGGVIGGVGKDLVAVDVDAVEVAVGPEHRVV